MTDPTTLTPDQFEQYVADLYQARGYRVKRRGAVNQADAGVDIEARKWRLYLVIQCKRYQGTVPFQDVQRLAGAVAKENATKGVLVTTGQFTTQSYQWIQGLNIELIDRQALQKMVRKQRFKRKLIPKLRFNMPTFNPFSWFGLPKEISITESPPEEVKRTHPNNKTLQMHQHVYRLQISQTNPSITASATVTNDHLKKDSTVTLAIRSNSQTITQAEAAIKFHEIAIKQATKRAKYRISNR